jgi:hypothetical protein
MKAIIAFSREGWIRHDFNEISAGPTVLDTCPGNRFPTIVRESGAGNVIKRNKSIQLGREKSSENIVIKTFKSQQR